MNVLSIKVHSSSSSIRSQINMLHQTADTLARTFCCSERVCTCMHLFVHICMLICTCCVHIWRIQH